MKARVFLLSNQDDELYEKIKSGLARVLRGISVVPSVYEDADYASKQEIGASYLKLLKSSMVKVTERDVTLYVEDELGQWGYWGGMGGKAAESFGLTLRHSSKTNVFPSVAVMNRMVMVPEGIHDALDAPKELQYLFKPFDGWQGVILVDFKDEGAIGEAIERVGAQIISEIATLIQRYIFVHATPTPDLKVLSKLLDVDEDFLKGLGDGILKPAPNLVAKITGGPARQHAESRVTLEVWNESDGAPGIVQVQVKAPYKVMESTLTHSVDFSSPEVKHQDIPLIVRPRTIPFCPLAVRIGEESFPRPLILDVVEN